MLDFNMNEKLTINDNITNQHARLQLDPFSLSKNMNFVSYA